MDGPSPNHGDRRGQRPRLIVLHYTGMADAASARARLCDPAAEVSAHWLIHENGFADMLVAEDRRAWHAGDGSWQGQPDVNSRSIGIEIANPGNQPFAARQMDTLENLLGRIMSRWQMNPEGVIAHSDMSPGRKVDPGPRFDWERLARQGLSIWPTGRRGPALPLHECLTRIGYPDVEPAKRLAAFRLRFRPWAHGPESDEDLQIAASLLAV